MPVVVIVDFLFEWGCVNNKIVRGGIKNSVELFQRPLKDFRETGKALVRWRKIRLMLLRQYDAAPRPQRRLPLTAQQNGDREDGDQAQDDQGKME